MRPGPGRIGLPDPAQRSAPPLGSGGALRCAGQGGLAQSGPSGAAGWCWSTLDNPHESRVSDCSSIGRDVNLNAGTPEIPFPQVELFINPFINCYSSGIYLNRLMNERGAEWP